MSNKVKVEFQPTGKRIEVETGQTVFEAALTAGAALASDCGGRGTCGRCRVEIISGRTSEPDDKEREVLARVGAEPGERLACRCRILGETLVNIPRRSRRFDQRLQITGVDRRPEGDMLITTVDIAPQAPKMEDQRSDLQRLLDAAGPENASSNHFYHPDLVSNIIETAGSSDWRMTVYLENGVPIGLGPLGNAPLGLAVDLGSSKIAGRLVDMRTGREIVSTGVVNPQIPYGEDVISRLNFAIKNKDGAVRLQKVLHEALAELVEVLTEEAGVKPADIIEAAVCGNTAMSHLLLGLPVNVLAKAPYIAGFSSPLALPAKELGLRIAPCAKAFAFPCIGGFVGGDHTAMILACDLDRPNGLSLGVDVGTNTEVVISHPGTDTPMASASCASGPAFEGAQIRDGMRAATGAISKVKIENGRISLETIGDRPPIGICGSGLLDAIAEMVKAGVLDERGRIQDGPGVVKEGRANAFVLVPAEKSGSNRDILITQSDVSQLQLAKGAIRAGIEALFNKTGAGTEDVARLYIAGAFGSFLNPQSAVGVGLLPDLPEAEFIQAGNAALIGASLALVSETERRRAAEISRRTRHIELAADPQFTRDFARALKFTR